MSQALTLARPYARAAFATARDEGAFAPWSDALAFSAHVAADPRVAALLANPELGRDDAVALLAPVSHGETYCASWPSWPNRIVCRCCRKSPACSTPCAPKPSTWSRPR